VNEPSRHDDINEITLVDAIVSYRYTCTWYVRESTIAKDTDISDRVWQ